jgi:signal transduction histidine kinase
VTILLGILLGWLLYAGIFAPLRRIAERAAAATPAGLDRTVLSTGGQIEAIGRYLTALMTEASVARSSAEQHRAAETHAERLAGIGRAVTHIVHEIRNRLALLGGYALLISQRPEDVQGSRAKAWTVYGEALRLEGMLCEIMAYARPVRMRRTVLSLNALLKGLVARLREQLPANIVVTADLAPSLPEVCVDSDRIEQVMLNLIRNASDAMPGGGTIVITTRTRGDAVTVSVRDEGSGIAAEMRDHLFTPFNTTKKTGNGLGLAICRQIVVDHGGSIDVESPAGCGATFNVVLPAARNESSRLAATPTARGTLH